MSRIGKKPIIIPSQVVVQVTDRNVLVQGPKGKLEYQLPEGVVLTQDHDQLHVKSVGSSKQVRANHGLVRSLLANMVVGVSVGFRKVLKLVGTGYRVNSKGAGLSLSLGLSHLVEVPAITGISFKVEGNDIIEVSGIDKQLVGQVAANIRALRPPDPYQGKGVRYQNEQVKLKPGKTTS